MMLTRWNPVRDLAALEVELLNRMFDQTWTGEPMARGAWVPAVDIYETKDKDVLVKVDLPEVKREDIKVTFENNVLSIEGQRELGTAVEHDRFQRIERGHGAFRRSFTLPSTVDGGRIEATYTDGVLTIRLPRREEARPKQIQIG